MTERTRLGTLVGVMGLLAAAVAVLSIWPLYSTAFENERRLVADTAAERAADMAAGLAVASRPDTVPKSLLRIKPSFGRFRHTGEVTIIQRVGDRVIYLPLPGNAPRTPPIDLADAPVYVQRALQGQTGVAESVDREGVPVLAGYATVPRSPYGVVVKINRRELQAPFVKAALIAAVSAVLAILLGIVALLRVLRPIHRRLAEREKLFGAAFNSTYQLYGLLEKDGTIREINRTAELAAGRPRTELIGRKLWEAPAWVSEMQRERVQDAVNRAAEGQVVRYATNVRTIRGDTLSLDVLIRPMEGPEEISGLLIVEGRDITEARRYERALRVLSTCNQRLIRATDEQQLLDNICRSIQEIGDYRMVWVGYAEQDDAKRVRPVAKAGVDKGYLEALPIGWGDDEAGRGAVGTAIRTAQPCVIRDTRNDPRFAPWRETIDQCDFESVIALPLRHGERTFGTLTMYSVERDAFDAEEQRLLEELADDLAYGIAALRARTERDEALANLRRQEATLRAFFEASAVVLALLELDQDDLLCHVGNTRWAGLFGVSPSEVTGRALRQIDVDEADRAALVSWFSRCRQANEPLSFEFSLSRKGQEAWYQASISPVGPLAGTRSLFSLAAVEITERRKAEAALRDSEERFRLAFDCAGVGMGLGGPDGRLLRVNHSLCRMLGYDEEDLVGRLFFDLVHPEDRGRALQAAQALVCGEIDAKYGAGRCLHRDGHAVWAEMTTVLLRDADGQPLQFVSQIQDVSQRRQAQEALERTESLLSGVLNTSPEAILALRAVRSPLGDIEDFECLLANATAHQMTGRALPRLVGARMRDGAPASHMQSIFTKCVDVVQTGRPLEEEMRVDRDGRTRWFRVSAVKLDDGLAASFSDITERKELQQQFLHAQKMEAVGRLAGGMAHDFNNVLTAILGLSDLALLEEDAGAAVRGQIDEIREAAQRAAALTRQLLVFSRRQTVQPAPLDLDEVVGGVERIVRRIIGEDIEFKAVLDEGLWPVRADRTQIEQVLMNLAVNARDAMPSGGTLTIKALNVPQHVAPRRDLLGVAPGDYVLLAVTDTGHGMPPEVRARIFEPFFTTKDQGKGTGLGLATVYAIVKQCGGAISVQSEETKGSTFRVYLPRVTKSDVSDRPALETAPHEGGDETVLLVEDDDHVRRLAEQILQQKGYKLYVARDGAEALALVQRHHDRLDLVLSDIVMPRMGGIDLARRIQESYPNVRLLLMSGYTEQAGDCSDILSPSQPFLQKPFSRAELLQAVRAVLDAHD